MDTRPEPPEAALYTIEAALRYLGTRDHGVLVDLLEHAIDRPHSATGKALASLTEPTTVLEGWTAAERAHALWRMIREGVQDPDVSPTPLSRRRRSLQAAFRLPDVDIQEPWASSLTERFKQLKSLKVVFGEPTSTQPMEIAWKRGVRGLAMYLDQRFAGLQTPVDWDRYRPKVRQGRDLQDTHPDEWQAHLDALDDPDTVFRQPSKGAQPIFANLFITTVFMKDRAVHRRITERLITAQTDGVSHYVARALPGADANVIVRALWGCRAERVVSPPGEPVLTRLWFPGALRRGQQHWFSSEVIDQDPKGERRWINVEVDHYGIAPGERLHGTYPIRGLTIRIRFQEDFLPEAVWWYAELTERERYIRPPGGDPHLLTLVANGVEYTFTQWCQPRENYGLSILWPAL